MLAALQPPVHTPPSRTVPPARALLARGNGTERAVRVVLALLGEQLGMDVVFVRQYTESGRRFRMVEALSHGRAAALATGQDPAEEPGVLLEAPVVLPNGRVHGTLCCFSPGSQAHQTERDLRSLRHGARLASRLLDNEQVLQELTHRPDGW
jgi:hypothetical protein